MSCVSLARVLGWRMRRQFLTEPRPDVEQVARRLCGVQAQVGSAAELALSLRLVFPSAGLQTAGRPAPGSGPAFRLIISVRRLVASQLA